MKKILICSMIIFLAIHVSCALDKRVNGSGNVTTEERAVSSFTKMEVEGVFTIFLSQGDKEAVEVEIDDNIQPFVKVQSDNGTLKLSFDKKIRIGKTTKNNIYVTLKNISELDVEGVCNISTASLLKLSDLKIGIEGVSNGKLELECKKIDVDVEGVSSLVLLGRTETLVAKKDGVGAFDSSDLMADNVTIDNSGVGGASVYASKELSMNNSGVGGITYSGDAVIRYIKSGGIGGIKKK